MCQANIRDLGPRRNMSLFNIYRTLQALITMCKKNYKSEWSKWFKAYCPRTDGHCSHRKLTFFVWKLLPWQFFFQLNICLQNINLQEVSFPTFFFLSFLFYLDSSFVESHLTLFLIWLTQTFPLSLSPPLPADWDPLRAPAVPDIRGRTPALWLLSQSKIFVLHRHRTNTRRSTDHEARLTSPPFPATGFCEAEAKTWLQMTTHTYTHTCSCHVIIHNLSCSSAAT